MVGPGVRMSNCSISCRARSRIRPRRRNGPGRQRGPAVGEQGQVVLDGEAGRQPGVEAILGDGASPARWARRASGRPIRVPAISTWPRGRGPACPPRPRPARAARCRTRRRRRGSRRPAPRGRCRERRLAAVAVRPRGRTPPARPRRRPASTGDGPLRAEHHVAADHEPGEVAAAGVGHRVGALAAAVAQDGDPVGDGPHLVELVGDEDDRPALVGHAPQHPEQGLGLLRRQDRGRLVEDEDAGVAGQRLEDLDPLLLADRQLPHPGRRVDRAGRSARRASRTRGRPGAARRSRPCSPRTMFSATVKVLDQAEVLVDHADAGVDGVAGGVEHHRPAVDLDPALVGPVEPGEDVGQRRLPGAVLAQQGVDLAGRDLEVDRLVGDDAAEEPLGDAARGQRRGSSPGAGRLGPVRWWSPASWLSRRGSPTTPLTNQSMARMLGQRRASRPRRSPRPPGRPAGRRTRRSRRPRSRAAGR